MAVLFSTSFEGSGVESGWSETVGTGCTLDWDETGTTPPDGGGSEVLQAISASTGYEAYAQYNDSSERAKTFARIYIRPISENLGNNDLKPLIRVYDGSVNLVWQISLFQTGNKLYFLLSLWNNGTFESYVSSEIVLDSPAWYRVEVKYDDSANAWEWKVNGVTQDSDSLAGAHWTGCQYWIFGVLEVTDAHDVECLHDLIKVDDADWPGPEVELSIPVIIHHMRQQEIL